MRQEFTIDETGHEAALGRRGRQLVLLRGDGDLPVELRPLGAGAYLLRAGTREVSVFLASDGDATFVHLDGESYRIDWRDPLERLAQAGSGGLADVAQAPMPGTVIAVKLKVGDPVRKGQTMMLIESMKLETAINAWRDGVIAKLHYAAGQTFDRAAALVTLESLSGG